LIASDLVVNGPDMPVQSAIQGKILAVRERREWGGELVGPVVLRSFVSTSIHSREIGLKHYMFRLHLFLITKQYDCTDGVV